MKFKIETYDGGFSVEIDLSGETPRRAGLIDPSTGLRYP